MNYRPAMDGVLARVKYRKSAIVRTDNSPQSAGVDSIEVIATGEDVKRVKVGDKILIDQVVLVSSVDMTKALGMTEDKDTLLIQIREYQVWGTFLD